jgi:hypothetical protein
LTQFMQVVKPQPEEITGDMLYPYKWYAANKGDFAGDISRPVKCPFGKVENVIAVRETWAEWGDMQGGYVHKANGFQQRYGAWEKDTPKKLHDVERIEKWNPAATMPREAARLFLRITNIRVMKTRDLTEQDARAQGHEVDIVAGDIWTATDFLPGKDKDQYYWVIDFSITDKPIKHG